MKPREMEWCVPPDAGEVDGGNYFVFTMIWRPPVQSGWMGEMSMAYYEERKKLGRDSSTRHGR